MKILSAACSDLSKAAEIRKNGADEIIIACENQTFSAMKEYPVKTILSFVPEGHAMGLRVSVMMNRLYGQEEILDAGEVMKQLTAHGVDGIYFADPGLLNGALKIHQEKKMIYEPETLLTSYEDASFWMEQGVQSVVISPLLTKEEILEIAGQVPHASLIIHGRQLMSVSRRHLLQAYADASGKDISFSYRQHLSMREEKRDGYMPVYENACGTMIYTDFIQESFDELPAFMEHGVERFILQDTDLPEPAYSDAIKAYRKILDGGDAGETGEEYRKRYSDLPLSNGYYGQKTIR